MQRKFRIYSAARHSVFTGNEACPALATGDVKCAASQDAEEFPRVDFAD